MHLFIMEYETDAERKRIDYAIERWKDKIKIIKPRGTIIIVEGDRKKLDNFIEDMHARLEKSEKKLVVYEVKDYQHKVEKNIKKLLYETEEDINFIKKFLDYLMVKLNAGYEYRTKLGKVYRVYTKKGQAKIEVSVQDKNDKCIITIRVEGYGAVVDFLSNKIDSEIRVFLEEG